MTDKQNKRLEIVATTWFSCLVCAGIMALGHHWLALLIANFQALGWCWLAVSYCQRPTAIRDLKNQDEPR